ncbi:hypothetical protein OQA88_13273 [Cercophora sp. LCS_1]
MGRGATYVEFRKYVRNMIDWGKDKRLSQIRDSLGSLLEENFRSGKVSPPTVWRLRNRQRKGQARGAPGADRGLDETAPQDTNGEPSSYLDRQESFFATDDNTASRRVNEESALPGHRFDDEQGTQDASRSDGIRIGMGRRVARFTEPEHTPG